MPFLKPRTVETPPPPDDQFPGVREPDGGTDFLSPDPDLPALPRIEPSVTALLETIAANTMPRDRGVTWFPIHEPLPATVGEQSFRIPNPVRHIYVPAVPRPLTLYAGQAREILLARLHTGQSLDAELPFTMNGMTIQWAAGPVGQQFLAYLSSNELDIEIGGTGPAQLSLEQRVAVGPAADEIVPANPLRRSLLIRNIGFETVYLASLTPPTVNSLPLDPGEAMTFSHGNAIQGITGGGAGSVFVVEESA